MLRDDKMLIYVHVNCAFIASQALNFEFLEVSCSKNGRWRVAYENTADIFLGFITCGDLSLLIRQCF
jgi:hypothetical protein